MEAAIDDELQSLGDAPPSPPPESQGGEEAEEEEEPRNEEDEMVAKAQRLMDKVMASQDNPSPTVLHALASLLETQEQRYMEESGHSSSNGRAAHNVGRLGTLVREHDDFFELVSAKYLSDTRFSASVQAAAARLFLCCSVNVIYPPVFEEDVLEKIKDWVIDETSSVSVEYQNWKHDLGGKEVSDYEMLKTYSTGLLALCLAGGGPVVEDVLTSGLSAKLMRYLRVRVLGESSISQKDSSHLTETKNTSGVRGRDEGRGRVRQVVETTHFEDSRITNERCLDEASGGERWVDGGEPPDGMDEGVEINDVDGKLKFGDFDENGRDDSARRRPNRGWARSRGKGRANEGGVENEQLLTSPGSAIRLGQGRNLRDKSTSKNSDLKKVSDSRKILSRNTSDVVILEREENDECFQDCTVGSKDITDLVKKAIRAAEAEARAANAPAEAIKAAGDAAAEVVKSAASEEFTTTNNEEAAVLAASRAASTVIDAANSIEALSGTQSNMNANEFGLQSFICKQVHHLMIFLILYGVIGLCTSHCKHSS